MSARLGTSGWRIAKERGPVVLVVAVGAARGARAAAAALTCAASEPDRAALLLDLGGGRPLRPSLIATAGARALEKRLVAHLPDARIASRGQICHLSLPPELAAIDQIAAALPLARESGAVIHLPPALMRPVLEEARIPATAVLLRADLVEARALAALAVRDWIGRGLSVVVLKQSPSWLLGRAASLGVPLPGEAFVPARMVDRLLALKRFPSTSPVPEIADLSA